MADQDFKIKVVTTADTTGIKQTSVELDKLDRQRKTFSATQSRILEAERARVAALNPPPVPPEFGGPPERLSFTRTAAGVGTIITTVTSAINKWKEFNAEQDRWVEGMIKAEEQVRALGESILEMQDKARDAARLGTEPLEQSFIRLQQEIIRLKTEQGLLNLPTQGEEWKKLDRDINIVEAQLKGVTSELRQQAAEAEKTAEKNAAAAESFLKGAIETASPQVQEALKNEEAARQARIAGLERQADLYQKSAEAFKRGMTAAQREEYEGLTKSIRLGPRAGPGESQAIIDEIARNKINFERQLKGEPPLPQGAVQGNQELITAIEQAFGRVMTRYWGP